MKPKLFVLLTVLIITGCLNKRDTVKQFIETDKQTVPDNDTEEKPEIAFIGGKQLLVNWDSESLYLLVNPEDPKICNNLKNLELFRNLKELEIKGENLDKVDFSPISLLTNLEKLKIIGNITRMPDMTNLKQLREVAIGEAVLESLESINGNGIERLVIGSLGSNDNIMLKISNMKNMNRLKSFSFGLAKIDIEGIDRFTSLEFISLENCEPYNINSIGNLKNLKSLSINLISDNPSLEFLKNMPNLRFVCFYGNLHLYRDTLFENEPSQVLDVTPLATLKELKDIICTNFIIKNIPALDVLDIPDYIDLEHSILYDETEESRHWLKFIRGDR